MPTEGHGRQAEWPRCCIYTFTLNNGAWNTEEKHYSGSATSGTLLLTGQAIYDFSETCTGCTGAAYIRAVTHTTIVPRPSGNLTKKAEYSYDTPQNANITSVKEWNFYTGTPSATPDRKTDITYLATSPYTSKNILNRPLSVTLSTGTGTWLSQTNYNLRTRHL